LVHVLPEEQFSLLRFDRNRYKITPEEQARLAQLSVGIVGLSVGNAVALTLALEGACGPLKLADFDRLDASNMNRVRAGVHELGLNKAVLAARQIYEINPYARLSVFPDGVTPDNLEPFLLGEPALDVLVDECDSLALKFHLRERARALRLPVLMHTSDRGMFDVERFDHEPERPLFHGLVGGLAADDVQGLRGADRVWVVLRILGTEQVSRRMGASMLEVDQTISTWPQLGSDVVMGGASVSVAVRRIGLGLPLPSGRTLTDVEQVLAGSDGIQPANVPPPLPDRSTAGAPRQIADDERTIPEWVRQIVEHAILAPSAGNVQPWHFFYDDATLWVVRDGERAASLLDSRKHASFLALGAAIENAAIAAAHQGFSIALRLLPDLEDASVVAQLSFEREVKPDNDLASWFDDLRSRVTNRQLATRVPLAPNAADLLREAARSRGCSLQLCTEEEQLRELAEIIAESDRIRFLCRELHREAMGEIRWSPQHAHERRDGVDLATLGMTTAQVAAMGLLARPDVAAELRAMKGGAAIGDPSRERVAAASGVGLLRLAGDSVSDWLCGGRAMQRVWLAATGLGLAFQPMTVLLYLLEMLEAGGAAAFVFTSDEQMRLRQLRERMNRVFPPAGPAPAALLFRLARAPRPGARALRLPVDRVLSTGRPPKPAGG